jgi:predicted dehydrogenase
MEFIGGDVTAVSGGRFSTVITQRPKPLGAVSGHGSTAVSDELDTVENDDYATFNLQFASGAAGAVEVSRVAAGHPNSLVLEVFGSQGAARWEQDRPSELQLFLNDAPAGQNGYRQVLLGNDHPYVAGGAPIDVAGVGFGQNEGFAYQARAFLEEVVGIPESDSLPRNASFDEGVHNMVMLDAVAVSAAQGGAAITVGK